MKVYTLKKKNDTEELHLFEGVKKESICTSGDQSICTKMKKSESIQNIFACFNENNARKKCAEIGRSVCGVCVSHLYESYV